jgi:uncharacterized protein (TIGR03083 family)
MLNAQTYLEHIRRDGGRIAQVSRGNLTREVPSCPGNTVESLLLHVNSVVLFWIAAIEANGPPQPDLKRLEGDQLDVFDRGVSAFVELLGSRDPDEEAWVWGNDPHMRFWYRRAAQELSIHRWDFENAVGDPLPIDPTLAADGFEELLEEFGPTPERFDVKGAAERFGGSGERLRFQPTDLPEGWTITVQPNRFDIARDGEADVTARGTASDINLFVWGRVGPDIFDVTGDWSLLDRWREKVKI